MTSRPTECNVCGSKLAPHSSCCDTFDVGAKEMLSHLGQCCGCFDRLCGESPEGEVRWTDERLEELWRDPAIPMELRRAAWAEHRRRRLAHLVADLV